MCRVLVLLINIETLCNKRLSACTAKKKKTHGGERKSPGLCLPGKFTSKEDNKQRDIISWTMLNAVESGIWIFLDFDI